jgi:methyl-accepting chemotaxis protein
MEKMQGVLHAAIIRIRGSWEMVASSASQPAVFSEAVRQSTTIQSESVSAIAANIKRLTVSIRHIAEITRDGASQTANSDLQASKGKAITDQLVNQIRRVAGEGNTVAT